jgi:signal peptidase I
MASRLLVSSGRQARRLSHRRRGLFAIGMFLALAICADWGAGLSVYRVTSSSMEPTLHCSGGAQCGRLHADEVLASTGIYRLRSIRRGDIVAFQAPQGRDGKQHAPGRLQIKRVVGLPGDEIEERRGYLFINGRRLRERYVRPSYRDHSSFSRRRIPPHAYFLLGDNRRRSNDSRSFGAVPRPAILGKVIFVIRPVNRIGLP